MEGRIYEKEFFEARMKESRGDGRRER